MFGAREESVVGKEVSTFRNYRQLKKRCANFLARRAPVATAEACASVQEGRYVIAVPEV